MSSRETPLALPAAEDIMLTTPGGHRISLRLFAAEASRSVVILAGAMGVNQRAYARFAEFLRTQGFTVITFDYFGSGASLHTHLRDCPVRVTDWGAEDCSAVIRYAREQYPDQQLQWMGHSVGGQLLGMTPEVNRLDHAITIACGSGYWWQNSPPTKRVAWLLWYLVAPASLQLCGYFPGKRLNMVGDLPPNVMRQWRRWCLHPEYAVGVEGESLRQQFAAVQVPISAIAFTDDEMMSETNTQSMHSFFAQTDVNMQRIDPADIGERNIGHLGWFREQYRDTLWQGTLLPLLQAQAK
ncbi:alpha/beta hydrolase family protein [Halopseudomonas salegens]|uniref:Predicted alpha/beta hydrolase n=1 Tax=Halopseudomonas salegens TaxID=1434072 RepID=A0A1H2HLP3_9GAMM|nr:alpha/beta fold hydrolase [Halopseudomonas salegens]SDU32696.1 Predicted alpha/beta hydrolase [Halopseudomonas salegens]